MVEYWRHRMKGLRASDQKLCVRTEKKLRTGNDDILEHFVLWSVEKVCADYENI